MWLRHSNLEIWADHIYRGEILIGGWSLLARAYRSSNSFDGQFWNFQSGQIGVRNEIDSSLEALQYYRSCLHIGANREGMHLSMFLMFRLWHPPLFVPWSDISVSPSEGAFSPKMKFDFQSVPLVSLYLRESLGRKVIKYAAWYSPSTT